MIAANKLLGINAKGNSMKNISEKLQYKTCPVCSGSIRSWRVKNMDIDKYNIDLCEQCGFAFVNPRPSFNFLMEYYSRFGHGDNASDQHDLQTILCNEKKYPNSSLDAKRMIRTIKSLTENVSNNRFLDVGCGYGFFSKEAMDAGFDVIALELAGTERRIASEMTGLNPVPCSFEEFDYPSESVAVVFMSQILEHALDVNLWVHKARRLLIKDGLIAIALPNFGSIFRMIMQENEPYICPPAHLNFFNQNSLSRLLEKHGFKVESIEWVSRIPKRTFEKRIPKFGKPMLRIINTLSSISLKIIDVLHLGIMINVYGRKIGV